MNARRAGLAAALGVTLLAACGSEAPPAEAAPADPYATPPELPAFELRPVVGPALERLAAVVPYAPAAGIGPGVEEGPNWPEVPEAEADAGVTEDVRGLTEMLASARGDFRDLALADAAALGAAAIPALIAEAADASVDADRRAAALEVLGRLADDRAEIALLELLRTLPEPGLRAHAAWRLSEGDFDAVVPALVLRLKYEHDPDVLRWIATALARHANYAGVVDLLRRAEEAGGQEADAAWRATPDALAVELGLADGAILRAAWEEGDPTGLLPTPERGAAFELAAWRWVQRLSDFQLRGVDDARFVFERLDAPAAALLAEALHDEDVYVRTHAAQCLERMGPRARVALPALVAALADPRIGARAANALGRLGVRDAEAPLLSVTAAGVPAGVRLGAVRALARRGQDASRAVEERLRTLFEEAPSAELWQAAGEGLLARDAGPDVLRALAPCLVGESPHGPVEPRTTDEAVRAWLARRAAEGEAAAEAALERWDAVAIDSPYFVPPEEDVRAMRAARRELAVTYGE